MNINDDQVYFFRKKLYKSKDEVVCVVVREWRGTLVKILFNIKKCKLMIFFVWPQPVIFPSWERTRRSQAKRHRQRVVNF